MINLFKRKKKCKHKDLEKIEWTIFSPFLKLHRCQCKCGFVYWQRNSDNKVVWKGENIPSKVLNKLENRVIGMFN
jgi:hypothetical protein